VVVPLVVGTAGPTLTDLAGVLRWSHKRLPGLAVALAEPVGMPQYVVGWLAQRAGLALARSGEAGPLAETALMVVSQGCGVPQAHAEVYSIARLLWEGRDYGLVEVAFEPGTAPDIAAGLRRCVRLGVRRIVVLPLTLLSGPTYDSICNHVDLAQTPILDCQVLLAGPLLGITGCAMVVEQRVLEALERWSAGGGNGLVALHTHALAAGEGGNYPQMPEAAGLLPPRYRDNAPVSAAPMGAAPLLYDAAGQVAWDRMWAGFCELALAGGPPHRGTLLEPVTPGEIAADPEGYRRVLDEIGRGLQIVTGLPVITGGAGWIGLNCTSVEMALWLLRAIIVENISVRREDTALFLPAGPGFRLEYEIKNIITAVAKTYHYWNEHQAFVGKEQV
jgi:sirohydrochlorin cobaltochelatase